MSKNFVSLRISIIIAFVAISIAAALFFNFVHYNDLAYTLPVPMAKNFFLPKGQKALPYPSVAISELTIQKNGARTLRDFITQIILRSAQVKLSKERYDALLKDKQGIILLPVPLIERALAKKNFTEVRPSLLILKDFIGEQEQFVRSVPVRANNASAGKLIVGFQRLTMNLIDKALDREVGKVSAQEFQNYFLAYTYTANNFYNSMENAKSIALSPDIPARHEVFSLGRFMESELQLFANMANAQSVFTPFGGKINEVDSSDCYCVGMVLNVDDYASKNKNLRLVLAYPMLFLLRGYKHPQEGYLILGTYLNGAGICLSGEYCDEEAQKDGLIIAPPTGTN